MPVDKEWKKVVVIALMIGAILSLHYLTSPYMGYRHAVYRMLFYLPLVQASPAGERVLVRIHLESGEVLLKVADRGCGITEEHRDDVFHPFFSTKKAGTGLGLGIVKKIVEAHEGDISFQSNPEKGVTFSVRLPF